MVVYWPMGFEKELLLELSAWMFTQSFFVSFKKVRMELCDKGDVFVINFIVGTRC